MIMRVHKTENYTVISNYHFKEKNMSLRAKGLLSLMLSLPDDWNFSVRGLAELSKDGKDSVSQALNELEEFGYLTRTEGRTEGGKFTNWEYDVYEMPIWFEDDSNLDITEEVLDVSEEAEEAEEAESEEPERPVTVSVKPCPEKPCPEKPCPEIQTLLNTNISNTIDINNKYIYTRARERTCTGAHTHTHERTCISERADEKKRKHKFKPPTLEEVQAYVSEQKLNVDAEFFHRYYTEADWKKQNGKSVENWKLTALTWHKRGEENARDTARERNRTNSNGLHTRTERGADNRTNKDPDTIQKYANAFIKSATEKCEWELDE